MREKRGRGVVCQENCGLLSGFPLAKKKELDAETSSA